MLPGGLALAGPELAKEAGMKLVELGSLHSELPHIEEDLATRMEGSATLPDGRVVPLLSIPRWNMRWQDLYR